MEFQIPKRTSSKRNRQEIETERDGVEKRVKEMSQSLKPQASFNSAYWIQSAQIAMESSHAVKLRIEISKREHEEQNATGDFHQSQKAKQLREQLRALEADERSFKRQAELLNNNGTGENLGKSKRRAFIELFTTSKIGLGILGTGRGKRNSSAQSSFRAACIDAYDSRNPDPRRHFLWCPIMKIWVGQDFTTASHLFAYMHGQDMMNSIFGPMKEPELFSPLNGMLISQIIEKKFDSGFMAIVPRLSDNPTPDEMSSWQNSEPKEYKIRILDLKDSAVNDFIRPESDQTWKELDNTNVDFRSPFRPRARYLYFHYCVQVLRRAWRAENKAAEQLKKEFGKGYWGTIGSYLPESMLRAFIEELGHEYDGLLGGAIDDKATTNKEDENLLTGVVSNQIKALPGPEEEDEDEDEDEDSDTDEDDGSELEY